MKGNHPILGLVPLSIQQQIPRIQQFLDPPSMESWPIRNSLLRESVMDIVLTGNRTHNGMIVRDVVLLHPFRDLVIPIILDVTFQLFRSPAS